MLQINHFNEVQQKAVNHDTGPAMILAGPGSGKTTVIIGRVNNLIRNKHISASSILVLTFTKTAALSMEHRFHEDSDNKILKVTFSTFHALFYTIIKNFTDHSILEMLTNNDKDLIIRSFFDEKNRLNTFFNGKITLTNELEEQILRCISQVKNGISYQKLKVPDILTKEEIFSLYEFYQQKEKQYGKIDFDDMMLHCERLFLSNPGYLSKWKNRFQYIMVDEFQDCNPIQYRLLKRMVDNTRNIYVVGDDDQAIYGFRGSNPSIMKQFQLDYPDRLELNLALNYRCRKEIIDVSYDVIRNNCSRITKEKMKSGFSDSAFPVEPFLVKGFLNLHEKKAFIKQRIQVLCNVLPYKRMAFLFRTNIEIERFYDLMKDTGIPFQYSNESSNLFNHFIVKDLKAYYTFMQGGRERRFFLQIMNKPERHLNRLYLEDDIIDFHVIYQKLLNLKLNEEAAKIKELQKYFELGSRLSPYLGTQMILRTLGYETYLKTKAGMNQKLCEEYNDILDRLTYITKQAHDYQDLIHYIEVQEKIDEKNDLKNMDGIILQTLHSAKGLEYDYVCIPNANEGFIPRGNHIDTECEEEERRLFYVGMTRAKKTLDILYLKSTKEHPRKPSRYIEQFIKN